LTDGDEYVFGDNCALLYSNVPAVVSNEYKYPSLDVTYTLVPTTKGQEFIDDVVLLLHLKVPFGFKAYKYVSPLPRYIVPSDPIDGYGYVTGVMVYVHLTEGDEPILV